MEVIMKLEKIIISCFGLCLILSAGIVKAETGFTVRSFNGSGVQTNFATILETQYVGQCPGVAYSFPEAWFGSDATSVGPGVRVKIQNVSPGMSQNPYPYADRGYSSGTLSEHTFLGLDTKHHGQTFSVQPGDNTLQFSIGKGTQVLEEGTFSLYVELLKQIENRSYECTWERRCYPTPSGVQCQPYLDCRCPF